MQVDKDIENARLFIKGNIVDSKEYRPVKLFTGVSLKTFKEYKISGKNVLTKYNSGDEVIDLLSYNGNVTCYSPNRFDEYFLYLKLAFLKENHKDFFSYFFKDYSKNSKKYLSYDGYLRVRSNLDDKTRYFFDEIFKKNHKDALYSKLLTKVGYDYNILSMYVRYLLTNRYYEARENTNVSFVLANDNQIISLVNELYSFINLSYELDKIDPKKMEFIMSKIDEDFKKILLENGKIQVFLSTKEKEIEGYKKVETKAVQKSVPNDMCKKQYAYVYTNK